MEIKTPSRAGTTPQRIKSHTKQYTSNDIGIIPSSTLLPIS